MSERSNQPAPWFRRALATLIDLFIAFFGALSVYVALLLIFVGYDPQRSQSVYLGLASEEEANYLNSVYGWTFLLAVAILIALLCLLTGWAMSRSGSRNGQTIGKQLLGIRAVRADGSDWTFSSALSREAVKKPLLLYLPWIALPIIVPVFISLADAISPLFDKPRSRAFHDRWARSRVWLA